MIRTSAAYKKAIVADSRRVRIKAIVRIVDPDLTYGDVSHNGEVSFSKSAQLTDENPEIDRKIITLEDNRWILNGEYIPNGSQPSDAEIGFVSSVMSGQNGEFSPAVTVTIAISGAETLRGAAIDFSQIPEDGVPRDFTVDIMQGNSAVHSQTFENNTSNRVSLRQFLVYNPSGIRITVTKWSLPYRHVRITEITAGLREEWNEDNLSEASIVNQSSFSELNLPYGTCTLTIDNLDRRFDPRNPDGIFSAIEEKQGVELYLGVDTESGTEYVPAGIFYQHQNGWHMGGDDPTITWNLADIIGLLQERLYAATSSLPTTLGAWIKALCTQLGEGFVSNYTIAPGLASKSCTVTDSSAVDGATCGQILLWLCQATGTFPRADAETGYLAIEPLWDEGVSLELDNLNSYPTMSANEDVSLITFTLSDGSKIGITGTSLSAAKTVSVNNPFLHTAAQANAAAAQIIAAHGGNVIETIGRGDFSSEIGDVASVQLSPSNATTGRVMYQNFKFQNGVLQACQTKLLQASGGKLYEETVVITTSQSWVVPAGVSYIRLVLGQGGQGGANGTDGQVFTQTDDYGMPYGGSPGVDGADGVGGKIWTSQISVTPGQSWAVTVGRGGNNGAQGGHTTFGSYSSANGQVYSGGYTDILNGNIYGRSAVVSPLAGSSDGGKGGKGGEAGYGYYRVIEHSGGTSFEPVISKQPGKGTPGVAGGSGFCMIQYSKVGG